MKFYNITDNVRMEQARVTADRSTLDGNRFCSVSPQDLPKPIRANFILNVETDELFITAGLQDRVVQVSEPSRAKPSRHPSLAASAP